MSQQGHQHKNEPAGIDFLPLKEWLKHSKDWAHNEYVRVIPDPEESEMRLYLQTGEAGSGEFVATRITVRTFEFKEVDRFDYDGEQRDPRVFHLHASDATTLLAWLDCLKWATAHADDGVSIEVRWFGDNGKGLTEESDLTEETLMFKFPAHGGEYGHQVAINTVWAVEQQRVARL